MGIENKGVNFKISCGGCGDFVEFRECTLGEWDSIEKVFREHHKGCRDMADLAIKDIAGSLEKLLWVLSRYTGCSPD